MWLFDSMSDHMENDPSPDKEWLRAPIDRRWVRMDGLAGHGGMTFAMLILGVTLAFLTDTWLGLCVTAAVVILVVGIVFLMRSTRKKRTYQ